MSNLLWGIPVVLLCIAGYAIAWKAAKAGRYGYALTLIVLCGLILRVYVGADLCLHDWDERYHALVAKNLLKHWLKPTLYDNPVLEYDFKNWTGNHIWLHKQPLTLWILAISLKVFGLHAFSVRLPAIILSVISIKLVYDIAAAWYTKEVAVITAFLFSIHGLIIELAAGRAGTDSVDTVFLFFIVLGIWMSIRAVRSKKVADHILLGVIIGLGVLTKWLPALITIPVWAIISYPAYKDERVKMFTCFVCVLISVVAIVLPWQLYILRTFPTEARWEYAYNSQHLFSALEAHEGNFFYYFDHLRMKYGELIYLPVAWFIWYGIKSGKAANYAVLAWFWIPYLFFSIVATKMEAYTVIAAPAVFMITAIFFVQLQERIRAANKGRYVLILVLACIIGLPVRYSIERVKPFTVLDRNPDWNREIDSLRNTPINNGRVVLLNCPHPIETMFFTDCIAYEWSVDPAQVDALKRKGYNVLICGTK